MGSIFAAIAVGLALVLGAAFPAAAQNRVAQQGDALETIFKEIERQIIREYFKGGAEEEQSGKGRGKNKAKGKGGKGPPAGFAKRERLSPGLERQLQKNGTLPPGIAKRELPPGLAARLGPVPKGKERVIVGGDVALIDIATGVIVDILKDVLAN